MNYDIVIVYKFVSGQKVVERIFHVLPMSEEEKESLHDIAEQKDRQIEFIDIESDYSEVRSALLDL